jgi:hypothetical protein
LFLVGGKLGVPWSRATAPRDGSLKRTVSVVANTQLCLPPQSSATSRFSSHVHLRRLPSCWRPPATGLSAEQIVEGSFEHGLNEIVEQHLNLGVFDARFLRTSSS